jgi:hypothetical protein
MILADKLNTDFACNALELLARELAPSSPELGAVELSAHALLFIGAPQPPVGREHERLGDTAPLTVLKEWSSLGHLFDKALAPWKSELAHRATKEQREFLRRLEDTSEENQDMSRQDIESRPIAEVLPCPRVALESLEKLAPMYANDSMNHVYMGLALCALRFVIERGHVAALGRFLDEAERRHEPFDNE